MPRLSFVDQYVSRPPGPERLTRSLLLCAHWDLSLRFRSRRLLGRLEYLAQLDRDVLDSHILASAHDIRFPSMAELASLSNLLLYSLFVCLS